MVDLLDPNPTAVQVTHLVDGNDVRDFDWSPDGRKICFNVDVYVLGTWGLAVLDLSGGLGTASWNLVQPNVAGGRVGSIQGQERSH